MTIVDAHASEHSIGKRFVVRRGFEQLQQEPLSLMPESVEVMFRVAHGDVGQGR